MINHPRPLLLTLAFLLLLVPLTGCGIPELPPAGQPTIALTPTPTSTPTFTATPTPTQTPTSTPTPTPTATPATGRTPLAPATAQAQSRTPGPHKAPTATPTPATLTLVITEKEANRMAVQAMAQQKDIQVTNPRVDFRPGAIYLSGDAVLGFFKVNIGILATVQVAGGEPQVVVQEIDVNGSRATGFLRRQIEAMIAPQLAQLASVSEDFYVEDVTITEDRMIITGHPR